MRLSDLDGKRICIWGFGTEGQAALKALFSRVSATWSVYSDKPLSPKESEELSEFPPVRRYTEETFSEMAAAVDVVIKSPGVSLYSPRIRHLRERGVVITSGSSIWFAERPAGFVIGVTGTKGKSTTSALLRHCIRAAGHSCTLAGNFGLPLIALLDTHECDYWVIELSSYQLADLQGEIDIAILLNIFPEHLDWHGTHDQYRRDKLQITTCVSPSGTLISTTALLDSFSPDQKCLAYDAPGGPFQLDGRAIVYQGMRYELSTEIFPGRHLLVNLQAALTALQCTGISIPDAIASLASFEPLPHRLTPVGTMNGVHFIDDSISTIPESAAAAVDSLAPRPCILILGGFDRGRDWHSVVPDLCARSVKAVVCTGQNGPRIAAAFAAHGESGAAIPAVSCEQEFDAAVAAACRKAAAGDVVLLSPGSPSYDRFTSYIERGNAFRRLTQELSGGCC